MLRVMLLLTVRDYDFVVANVKPNATPRVPYTSLDLKLGDWAFQEMGLEARPRDGMMMVVTRVR